MTSGVVLIAVVVVFYVLHHWTHRGQLSEAWFADQQRAEWTRGEEGVSWRWPITKD